MEGERNMRIVDEETKQSESAAAKELAPELSPEEYVHRPQSDFNRLIRWILILVPGIAVLLLILSLLFNHWAWKSETDDLLSAEVGDTVEFGNASSESEEMCTWTVLQRDGDRILLVCNNYIGYLITEDDGAGSIKALNSDTWETTEWREYLNGDFYENVFDKKEKKLIAETEIAVEENEDGSLATGAVTKDKLFLLSADEVNPEISADWNTVLRTPGTVNPLYMGSGEITEISVGTYYYKPAMWLDLSSVK